MIFRKKKIFFNKKLPSFSIVEVMVSLFILSVVSLAALSAVFTSLQTQGSDPVYEGASGWTDSYIYGLYLATNLRQSIMNGREEAFLKSADLPVSLPELWTNSGTEKIKISRRIIRLSPLLVYLTVEEFFTGDSGKPKIYRLDTVLSENYLRKLAKR